MYRYSRLVERRHFVEEASGRLHDGHREHGGGALAQAEAEIKERPQLQVVEGERVTGLDRTVAGDEERATARDERRRHTPAPAMKTVDDHGHAPGRRAEDRARQGRDLRPPTFASASSGAAGSGWWSTCARSIAATLRASVASSIPVLAR